MNKWNRLLNSLDLMFGFTDKKKSTFRKVGQDYDEKNNEHVILIEYRVKREGESVVHKRKGGSGPLLRQISSRVKHQRRRSPQ